MSARTALALGVAVLAFVAAGCGGDTDSPDPDAADGPTATSVTPGDTPTDTPTDTSGQDCGQDLLTDAEVTEAIGEHHPATQDFVLGGCVWLSTAEPDPATGFVPAIHAAVLSEAEYEQLAEVGDPVEGFGEGATYDPTSGEFWFPCAGDQWCGLKVAVADSDEREDHAVELAEAFRSRAG